MRRWSLLPGAPWGARENNPLLPFAPVGIFSLLFGDDPFCIRPIFAQLLLLPPGELWPFIAFAVTAGDASQRWGVALAGGTVLPQPCCPIPPLETSRMVRGLKASSSLTPALYQSVSSTYRVWVCEGSWRTWQPWVATAEDCWFGMRMLRAASPLRPQRGEAHPCRRQGSVPGRRGAEPWAWGTLLAPRCCVDCQAGNVF